MKKVVFILIGSLLGGVVFGQNAYQDAKKLLGYSEIDKKSGNVTFSNLDDKGKKTLENYPNVCKNQINPYIVYTFPVKPDGKGPSINVETQDKSAAKGLSIPMIADGVAKFLVQRVKEELAVAFFERFAAKIKENIVLANLFPRTANALASMSEEIYMFSSYIELLREAMRSDVKEIWARLPVFLERTEVKTYLTKILLKKRVGNTLNIDIESLLLKRINEIKSIKDFVQIIIKKSTGNPDLSVQEMNAALKEKIDNNDSIRSTLEFIKDKENIIKSISNSEDKNTIDSLIRDLQLMSATENNLNKIGKLVMAAAFLMDGLVKEKHAGVILEELQDAKLDEMFNAIWDEKINPHTANNIKTLLKLTREISRSLKSEDTKSYWVNWKEFETQFKNDEKFRLLYLGLLYQRIKCFSLEFDRIKIPVSELFETSTKAQRCITHLALAFRDLELSIKQIENSGEKTSAGIYEYAEAYIKIFEKGLTLIDEMELSPDSHISLIEFKTKAQYYLTLARSLKNVFVGISQKDYSMAMLNVVNVWNPLMEVLKNMDSANKNIAAVQAEINSVLYKYGSFIAAVSKAENSDDVKKAIETIALPSGSYSMKRNSNFTLSLSGYVGLSGGWEVYREANVKELPRGIVSVCAPIGIDLVWGNYSCLGIASVGLFVSIVDLGALVAYRFRDDQGEIPEFSLKNILCPGVHIVYGFKKIPITVGIGCKFGPQLRKIERDLQTDQVLKDVHTNSFRYELFIGVDIPLLNFVCK